MVGWVSAVGETKRLEPSQCKLAWKSKAFHVNLQWVTLFQGVPELNDSTHLERSSELLGIQRVALPALRRAFTWGSLASSCEVIPKIVFLLLFVSVHFLYAASFRLGRIGSMCARTSGRWRASL